MSELTTSLIATRAGSRIAIHEGGGGDTPIFVVGGRAGRSISETPLPRALAAAATRGARFTIMDIAGSAQSIPSADLTMDSWLADMEEIFESRVGTRAIWIGASLGAWLMLLTHARHPEWFRSMCAIAPAFDWDQQYVGPGLRDGRLGVNGAVVTTEEGNALAPRELLVSMAAHHVMRKPLRLTAPLHAILGGRDEMAPAEAARRFLESASGAACTVDFLPDADHGVAKLDPPEVYVRVKRWLMREVEANA